MASMARGASRGKGLRRVKSTEEILLECSSAVALSANINRSGIIVSSELAKFFEAVNESYGLENGSEAAEKLARDILEEVGEELSALGAAKIKRLVVKLGVDISSFTGKQNYVDAVLEMTGTTKVVRSENFATWLRTKFSDYPEKLQKIQDIALDYLLEQRQHSKDGAHCSSSNEKRGGHAGTSSAAGGQPPKIETSTSGRAHAASPDFDYSFVSPRSNSKEGNNNSDRYDSRPMETNTPRSRHARRKTMIALDVFSKLDRHSTGKVSRRDFLLACRKDESVASYLGLPQKIRQEGDSRDRLEAVFQGIGSSDTVTVEEFVAHYRRSSQHMQ